LDESTGLNGGTRRRLHKCSSILPPRSSSPSASLPTMRVQFGLGAVLQHSITPSLRVAGSEDEDENEAPGEGRFMESLRDKTQQSCGVTVCLIRPYPLGSRLLPVFSAGTIKPWHRSPLPTRIPAA
jgi:hypothetical protein